MEGSVNRCELKVARIIEVFTGKDGFAQSVRVIMAHEELNRSVVKFAPVFYDFNSEIENSAGNVGATSKHQQELLQRRKQLLKMKKFRKTENSKMTKN